MSIDDRILLAIGECSCPREIDEILSAPKCEADHYLPSFSPKGTPLLFVKRPYMGCNELVSYGDTYLCACKNRKYLYKTYKL